jgi:hypothetical protein
MTLHQSMFICLLRDVCLIASAALSIYFLLLCCLGAPPKIARRCRCLVLDIFCGSLIDTYPSLLPIALVPK